MFSTFHKKIKFVMIFWMIAPSRPLFGQSKQSVQLPPQPNPTTSERIYRETTSVLNGTLADPTDLMPIVDTKRNASRQSSLWSPAFVPPAQDPAEKDAIIRFLNKNSQRSVNDRLKTHFQTISRIAEGFRWEWNLGEESKPTQDKGPKYGLVVQRITTAPPNQSPTAINDQNGEILAERNSKIVWTIAPIEKYEISPTTVNTWELDQSTTDTGGSSFAHPWKVSPPDRKFSGKLVPKNTLGIAGSTPGVRAEFFQSQNIYRYIYETPDHPGQKSTSEHICEVPISQQVTYGQVLDEKLGPKRSTLGTQVFGAASRIHYEYNSRKYIAEAVKYVYNWRFELNSEAGNREQSSRIVPLNFGVKIQKDF